MYPKILIEVVNEADFHITLHYCQCTVLIILNMASRNVVALFVNYPIYGAGMPVVLTP